MITNNYIPYSGRVVSSLIASVHALRSLGHRVIIITLDFLDNYSDVHEYDVIRVKCPLKFIYNDNYIAVPWCPNKAVFKVIKDYAPDIIHVHHPFILGLSGLKAAKKLDIPVVFTYHTMYEKFVHHIPLPQFFTRAIATQVVKSFCQKVDALIVPSSSMLSYLKAHNASLPHIIKVIPSGVLSVFEKNNFIYKPDFSKKRPCKILTVSRFAQEKNIIFLIDMFAGLNQEKFELTLVGYGSERENLKDYAYGHHNLSHNAIKFIIKPEKENLINFYDEADIFIFASLTETQGLVLAESMIRGTPIISRRGTGVTDIVKSYYNGIIIDTLDEMRSAINTLVSNPILFKALQYNAWKTGCHYTNQHCVLKLEQLYNNLSEV